ncbi:MAG: hypothetical protein OM95_12690 [Bdellovibrio sp. ArHS]|uniref:MerR family transcriptional regulator n=1 Tax=Bdellovibrio sp. ArHS TaxID=1569284 RepID=UPI0005838022|nr:MerR family transcriptional regulator [Bdellovibrio sp. ArHS]KHD87852.1 MAG: hypothetical protein OM95_12690 [Bdellovibrio sp. ArHS]
MKLFIEHLYSYLLLIINERVWEHRYAALKPLRTESGRRLYTENDVLKVRALLALTQQGYRVGDIAHKNLAELNRMQLQKTTGKMREDLNPVIKTILTKANAFAWNDVRTLVLQEKENTKPLNWVHSLVIPLLGEIGRQVDSGSFSIAQEHILSAIIKESLAYRFKKKTPSLKNPRLVFAAPEGDFHDIGLLIASHIAAELKANTLFLGPHMPKDELTAVCVRYKPTHLLLTSTTTQQDGAKDDFLSYVNFLDRNLDPKITFWLAGKNTQKYSLELSRPFKFMDSFETYQHDLKKCLK